MEQFVYSDIFDTKGIEYIVVIFFFILLIPFWRMLNRQVKIKEARGAAIQAISLQTLRIPQGIIFNRNHTWSHMEPSGTARIGMDDLLLHLTGGVELNYLKERKDKVKRGEPIARISREGKELVITSPISGEVYRVHNSLEENPEAITNDPYGSWLYRIRPYLWQDETSGAMMGEEASDWTGKELERFKDYLADAMKDVSSEGVVLQEGGELNGHPLSEMNQEAWKGFQEQFLSLG